MTLRKFLLVLLCASAAASAPAARAAPVPQDDGPRGADVPRGKSAFQSLRDLLDEARRGDGEGASPPGSPNAGAPRPPAGLSTWTGVSAPTPPAPPRVPPAPAPAPPVAAPAAPPAPAPGGGGQWVGLVAALSLGTVAAAVLWWHVRGRYWRAERRRARQGSAAGACRVCGYCLTGNASGVCPECGTTTGRRLQTAFAVPVHPPGRRPAAPPAPDPPGRRFQ